jgi:hypothetical protein
VSERTSFVGDGQGRKRILRARWLKAVNDSPPTPKVNNTLILCYKPQNVILHGPNLCAFAVLSPKIVHFLEDFPFLSSLCAFASLREILFWLRLCRAASLREFFLPFRVFCAFSRLFHLIRSLLIQGKISI